MGVNRTPAWQFALETRVRMGFSDDAGRVVAMRSEFPTTKGDAGISPSAVLPIQPAFIFYIFTIFYSIQGGSGNSLVVHFSQTILASIPLAGLYLFPPSNDLRSLFPLLVYPSTYPSTFYLQRSECLFPSLLRWPSSWPLPRLDSARNRSLFKPSRISALPVSVTLASLLLLLGPSPRPSSRLRVPVRRYDTNPRSRLFGLGS